MSETASEPSLAELRAAVADAAGVATGLWLSYLFTLFYMLLAVAGVTHQNLLLQDGIKLPFLSIELPLMGFFWLGPVILIVAHAYVLHHLSLLAEKARLLDRRLDQEKPHERDLLSINLFVQMLIGRSALERHGTNRLAKLVAWLTLVAGPVLVLVFFVLQFLPYHDEATTWWARITVLLDLALLWWLWPKVACRTEPSWRGESLSRACKWATAGLAVASCYLVLFVATFAGEWLEATLPPMPLHQTLVGGQLDENSFVARSLWSNRLIVPGVVMFDRDRYDTPAKVAAAHSPRSMRNRHLEQAILTEAQLSHVDFTGAHLEGASLVRAHAEGAWFDRANLTGAQLDDAEMEGASFYNAHMVGATASGIYLQGAQLAGANLRAAWLATAQLDGASLAGADLRWATLDGAHLPGVNMTGALLQHASLAGAVLDGASLDRANVLKTDFHGAKAKGGLRADGLDLLREEVPCVTPPNGACDPAETNEQIHALIARYVPDNPSRAAMQGRLFGVEPVEAWPSKPAQSDLQALQANDDGALVALWGGIACTGKAAPYVMLTLISTYGDPNWTHPRYRTGAAALIDQLQRKNCAGGMALPEPSRMLLLDLDKDRPEAPSVSGPTAPAPTDTGQERRGIGTSSTWRMDRDGER